MTAWSRPDASVVDGNWVANGAALLHECVDEVVPNDDTDYISTTVDTIAALGLSDVGDPVIHTDHKLRCTARAVGPPGEQVSFNISVYEGATRISSLRFVHPTGGDYMTLDRTLRESEAAQITDYAVLWLEVRAHEIDTGEEARITQIEFEVPYVGISVTPAPACAIAVVVNPTVHYGSTASTPDPAAVIADTINPTILIGEDVYYTPAAAPVVAQAVNPTVQYGSTTIVATPAAVVVTVVLGPAVATVIVVVVNPTVKLSTLVVAPVAAPCLTGVAYFTNFGPSRLGVFPIFVPEEIRVNEYSYVANRYDL